MTDLQQPNSHFVFQEEALYLQALNHHKMNCFHHTQDSAVAQCSDCGKGLCPECAGKYSPILCTPCFQKRKRNEIRRSILSLLLLVALFVIGFQWDFLASYGYARWASGYTLMAIWSGYILIGKFKRPNRIVIATPISSLLSLSPSEYLQPLLPAYGLCIAS